MAADRSLQNKFNGLVESAFFWLVSFIFLCFCLFIYCLEGVGEVSVLLFAVGCSKYLVNAGWGIFPWMKGMRESQYVFFLCIFWNRLMFFKVDLMKILHLPRTWWNPAGSLYLSKTSIASSSSDLLVGYCRTGSGEPLSFVFSAPVMVLSLFFRANGGEGNCQCWACGWNEENNLLLRGENASDALKRAVGETG